MEFFAYSQDNDLAGWFVRDVVENRHLRLLGQETSTQGIFIGPIYYYLLTPFYLIFNMDPAGGVFFITLLGVFAIISVYFVFSKTFSQKMGLIAAFLYSVSFYTVLNDREVVPTMPVITWSVWFLYALYLILAKKQKQAYLVLGILAGLIWHLNFALVLVFPLVLLAFWLSKQAPELKKARNGFLAFLTLSLPLIVFELRNDFLQTKALWASLTTDQYAVVSGYDKFLRTLHLSAKNLTGFLIGPDVINLRYEYVLASGITFFVFLVIKKVISKNWAILLSFWYLFFIGFFSFYSKRLSEYYLNASLIVWIVVFAFLTKFIFSKSKKTGVFILTLFLIVNIYRLFIFETSKVGYLQRKAVVEEIKINAREHNFPCVSISYITNPGYELGYRYFIYLLDLKTKRISEQIPVYTIVFPLRDDIKVDKTFDAVGLIYPDYGQYEKESIDAYCQGESYNDTKPLFGITF